MGSGSSKAEQLQRFLVEATGRIYNIRSLEAAHGEARDRLRRAGFMAAEFPRPYADRIEQDYSFLTWEVQGSKFVVYPRLVTEFLSREMNRAAAASVHPHAEIINEALSRQWDLCGIKVDELSAWSGIWHFVDIDGSGKGVLRVPVFMTEVQKPNVRGNGIVAYLRFYRDARRTKPI